MMAWLGTALKSSQPRRNASLRSARPMVRMTGAVAASGAAGTRTLPGYGVVAMVVVSLTASAISARPDGRMFALIKAKRDRAGREEGDRNRPRRELSGDA